MEHGGVTSLPWSTALTGRVVVVVVTVVVVAVCVCV